MPTVRVAHAPRLVVVVGEEESGIGALRSVLVEKPVHRSQKQTRLLAGKGELAAQVGFEVCPEQRRSDTLSRDVANQEPKPLLSQSKKVIVVAADMASLDTNAGV